MSKFNNKLDSIISEANNTKAEKDKLKKMLSEFLKIESGLRKKKFQDKHPSIDEYDSFATEVSEGLGALINLL